jgi:hypothetical protein
MTTFVIEAFTPVAKNSLLGFATVRMPSGMLLHDVGVHRQGGSFWAMPASKPMLDRSGTQLKDASGKLRWVPIVSFADKATRDRWSQAVVAALREQRPDLVAGDA